MMIPRGFTIWQLQMWEANDDSLAWQGLQMAHCWNDSSAPVYKCLSQTIPLKAWPYLIFVTNAKNNQIHHPKYQGHTPKYQEHNPKYQVNHPKLHAINPMYVPNIPSRTPNVHPMLIYLCCIVGRKIDATFVVKCPGLKMHRCEKYKYKVRARCLTADNVWHLANLDFSHRVTHQRLFFHHHYHQKHLCWYIIATSRFLIFVQLVL